MLVTFTNEMYFIALTTHTIRLLCECSTANEVKNRGNATIGQK